MEFRTLASCHRTNTKSRAKYYLTEEPNEDEDATTSSSDLVEVVDNKIYFSSNVNADSIHKTITELEKLIKKMQIFGITYGIRAPPITIYINSDGGEVHAALALFDYIKNSPVTINTIISGNASSAATIISLSGHNRKITENSYMLIHNISSAFWGKMHEFEDEMKNMAKLTKNLKQIYKDRGSIDRKTLDSLLKKDLLLDAKTCLKYGFIDEIV
tara:strand:+ start:33 stop:677 length:645 start_codon:yes stop_codon:yes gene_type:complete